VTSAAGGAIVARGGGRRGRVGDGESAFRVPSLSGNVTKMNEQAHDQRPVYLVEDTRAALITG
jgi:hypothetical protein